jgi:hypothetical protein
MALGDDLFPSGTLTHRSDTITHSHPLHARVPGDVAALVLRGGWTEDAFSERLAERMCDVLLPSDNQEQG